MGCRQITQVGWGLFRPFLVYAEQQKNSDDQFLAVYGENVTHAHDCVFQVHHGKYGLLSIYWCVKSGLVGRYYGT